MAHFSHKIIPNKLHQICLYHLDELRLLTERLTQWVKEHTASTLQAE